MVGVEIYLDSDEYQAGNQAFIRDPHLNIVEAQGKINEILNKCFNEPTRTTGARSLPCCPVMDGHQDYELMLQNKLAKVKSKHSWRKK